MQIASFLENIEFSDKSVAITSMIDNDFSKEIRIAFKKNQIMKEHKTKYPIVVMVLKGKINFTIKETTTILNQGDIISLKGNILHELEAKEESIVRLSLHKKDDFNRVKSILK